MTTSKRDDEMPLRDPHVEAAWRAASSEEPPPALDAAILAAARREVAAGPQPIAAHDARSVRSVRRQWWPLAAAATIGAIAAGLLQLVPHDELVAPGIDSGVVTDMPAAPAPSLPQVAAPPMPDDARKDAASAGAGSMRPAPPAQVARKTAPAVSMNAPAAPTNAQQDAGAVPPTVATLPEPFPAAEPKREASPAVGSSKADTAGMADARPAAALPPAGRAVAPASPMEPPAARLAASGGSAEPAQARGDAAPVAKLASEPTPAAPSASGGAARSATDREFARPVPQARVAAEAPRAEAATSVRARDRAPLPVAEWIALIRRLRAEGKTDEAVRELAAFRAAHADHERLLPADLRQWRPAEK